MRTRRAVLALLGALVVPAGRATADPCHPAPGLSTCIDADILWPRAGHARLLALGGAELVAPGVMSFGLQASYLSRPIRLLVPSPDPRGRSIAVVDDLVDTTLLWAFAPVRRLELTLALPLALYQSGSGLTDLTGAPAPLPRSALRDPRAGVHVALLDIGGATANAPSLRLRGRFEMAAPLADADAFAGGSTPTYVPSVAAEARLGRVTFALELGARLRGVDALPGARVGSQLTTAAGAAADVLPRGLLSAGLEAYALPSLVEPGAAQSRHIPAEWLVSARSRPFGPEGVSVGLGGGGALPLGGATTAPRYRFVLEVRYAPPAQPAP